MGFRPQTTGSFLTCLRKNQRRTPCTNGDIGYRLVRVHGLHFLIFNASSPAYPGSNQKGGKRQRLKKKNNNILLRFSFTRREQYSPHFCIPLLRDSSFATRQSSISVLKLPLSSFLTQKIYQTKLQDIFVGIPT